MNIRSEFLLVGLVASGLMVGLLATAPSETYTDVPRAVGTRQSPEQWPTRCDAAARAAVEARFHDLPAAIMRGDLTLSFSTFPQVRTPGTRSDYKLTFESARKQLILQRTSCKLQHRKDDNSCGVDPDECTPGTIVRYTRPRSESDLKPLYEALASAKLEAATGSETPTVPLSDTSRIYAMDGQGRRVFELLQQSKRAGSQWVLVEGTCRTTLMTDMPELGPVLAALTRDQSDPIRYIDRSGIAP